MLPDMESMSKYNILTLQVTVTWEDGKLQTFSKPTANSKAKATKVCREVVTQDGKQQLIMVREGRQLDK